MPISKDELIQTGKAVEQRKSVVTPAVETMLSSNKGTGYTNKEIAEATGMNSHTINSVVNKLSKAGKIQRLNVPEKGTFNIWIAE